MLVFYDTETVGLTGPAVLIQYSQNNNQNKEADVVLFEPWRNPIGETLKLIEFFMENELVGFNLTFDHFQLTKLYTMFYLLRDRYKDDKLVPVDFIHELGILEEKARFLDLSLKPKSALDLMLHARKGPFQSLMERRDIVIRRVPRILAEPLAAELEKRIKFDEIYFARRKETWLPHWEVEDVEGSVDFKNIILRFKASGALKALVKHIFGDAVTHYKEIELGIKPKELRFAPFAMAVARTNKKGDVVSWEKSWPELIRAHILHWAHNDLARRYAANDITYTRKLYNYFDCPPCGDDDSVLACYVGAARWRGYSISLDDLKIERENAQKRREAVPTAPRKVREYLEEVMDPIEAAVMAGSTRKQILEEIAQWEDSLAGERARSVLAARKAAKEIELFDKIIAAGRIHPSFKITGTLSNRMSGDDKFNLHGVNKSKYVRKCFTLSDPGEVLCGGDFDAFEVTIAEAVYNDPALRKILLEFEDCRVCKGKGDLKSKTIVCEECDGTGKVNKKIHGLFGMSLYVGMTYDQIMADKEKYTRAKSAFFSQIYGGTAETIHNKQGIDLAVAEKAIKLFMTRFEGVGRAKKRNYDSFCSMRQPNGIGSKVEWHDPAEYVESFLGFRRYFTLENQICKALFILAENPPSAWTQLKMKVRRRDREQFAGNAVRSALFAAAFNIQASNMRAAANHEIQSPGAQITKRVQRNIWEIQPTGVSPWLVRPVNIHDEVICPCKPEVVEQVEKVVNESVESFRPQVPLIKLKWKKNLKSWADK